MKFYASVVQAILQAGVGTDILTWTFTSNFIIQRRHETKLLGFMMALSKDGTWLDLVQ